ncbi:MAG TPA: DNA translocase FtsK, partial [Aggregatilineales bacterium]|nr:DNA translocase FtsK [Aggregatilineales bacterium]
MADTKTTKKPEKANTSSVKLVRTAPPAPSTPPRATPTGNSGTPTEPEAFWIDPERLGWLLLHRPAWVDEIGAIGLIVIGIVTLLALFDTSPAATGLSHDWALLVRQMVGGVGAVVFAGMIMAVGVLLALPKMGVRLFIPWLRILMIEIAYLAVLAIIHLLAHDPQPRDLARAGGGGGYVGWGLSEPIAKLLGPTVTIAFFTAIALLATVNVLGIRRKHVRSAGQVVAKGTATLREPWRRDPLHRRFGRAMGNLEAHVHTLRSNMAQQAEQRKTDRVNARRVARATDPRVRPKATSPEGLPSILDAASADAAGQLPAQEPIPTISGSQHWSSGAQSATPDSTADVLPSLPATSPSAPVSAPPRVTRHFTVEDFKEVRVPLDPGPDLPPMTLLSDLELNKPTEQEINNNVRLIENTLLEFDIDVEVVDVSVGPAVTQYAVQPFREVTNEQGEVVLQRVRVNKIASLANDLALALSAKRLRIQPYVPGRPYMGIEVPNRTPSIVALRPVMESEAFAKIYKQIDPDLGTRAHPLVVPLGRDVSGAAFVVDLAVMPHLLIAGTTGSGKSVCITALTIALVMTNTPDRLKLVMLDPKMVELSRFNGLPHLLGPVETDMERIIGVLRWATREMDQRYKLLEAQGARNLESYNRALGAARASEHLPYIVILVDEIGDLMLTRPDEMEHTLTRLAQMARAVGMHLVVATQRPSVDIITGLIKANFPARISFAVASGVDSRVILDATGAETLIGRGDMLYLASDAPVPQRLQGCFVADDEIDRVVQFWKNWKPATAESAAAGVTPWERGMTRREALAETDPLLEDAIDLVVREGEASPSLLQRRLAIGYPRAAQLIDMLAELGVIGPAPEAGRNRP